jgi:DNA-binding beta-propeller fold protein YncE
VATLLKSLVAAAVALALSAAPAHASGASDPFKLLEGPALTGLTPAFIALDPATHTLYVGNVTAPTLTLYDARTCSPQRPSGCATAIATARVGNTPVSLAIDRHTGTAYVSNLGEGTVSLFDATTCNATNVTGCNRRSGLVRLSGDLLGLAIDDPSGSVYVGGDPTLWLIDGRTCNATTSTGCTRASQLAVTGPGPLFPTIDPQTRTLYVGNVNGGSTVSLISTRTCNARVRVDCAVTDLRTGNSPYSVTVDPATHTLYVPNHGDGTLTVADRDTCNASVHSGCARVAATTPVGSDPTFIALDPETHTLHVANGFDSTLSAVDTAHCRAADTRGCDRRWPTRQTGAAPDRVQLDRATGTLFVSEPLAESVHIFEARACSAVRTTSCRREAPTVSTGNVYRMALDTDVHTLYLTEPEQHRLSLLDTAACAADPRRCTAIHVPVPDASFPVAIAIDRKTDTIYVTDFNAHTIVLIDARHCNVSAPSGCAPVGPAIATGAAPNTIAVNEATHAVFVTDAPTGTLSTFDSRHCNARDHTGCPSALPAGGSVGAFPQGIAIDPATGTVYVANFGAEHEPGIVSVVDATHCCASIATITVGPNPQRLALDPALRTLYVPNQAVSDEPGSVSVVDTRTCNAQDTSGCGRTPVRVASGIGSWGVAVDVLRHRVYTADFANATITRIDGTTCNALRTDGCDRPPLFAATGSQPTDVVFDPTTRTLYADNVTDLTVSVVDAR